MNAASKEPSPSIVTFTWRGAPGQSCELMGDFPAWSYPVVMAESEPGLYACTLSLLPGIYRYKFRVNRVSWHRDPAEDAVDLAEGFDNSLRIVAGGRLPILFAPDRRHLAHYEDGRLVVQLEVQPGQPLPHELRVSTPGGEISAPIHEVARRRGQVVARAEVLLATADAGAADAEIFFPCQPDIRYRIPPPRSDIGQPPAWAAAAVFYAIFVDRWHRSASSPADPRASPRWAPSTFDTYYGGDLQGIIDSLDYFTYLGVGALVMTPVHVSDTPHRYDGHDLLSVDPRLGGEEKWRELIVAAHRHGLRIVADLSLTHVNEAHPAFQDLLRHQEHSAYADWFRVRRHPVRRCDSDTVDLYLPHLPWLNLEPGPAREHVIAAAEQLVAQGVDGLRLDAMDNAPGDFWQELRERVRRRNPELLLLGEVVSDRPARYAEEHGVDLATDFQHRQAMMDFFGYDRIDAEELWQRTRFAALRAGPFDASFSLLFLDNHDTARFRGALMPYARLRLALTYLLARPEPVWLTYGTELGLGGAGRHFEIDDAWPDRLPMAELTRDAGKTQGLVRALLRLRKENAALRRGSLQLVTARNRFLVVDRVFGSERVRVYLNAGSEPVVLDLPTGAALVLASEEVSPDLQEPLPPKAARIVRW
jgi:cyclomaltodextrinase / maltogenic alpha-amylase / neopullulanase